MGQLTNEEIDSRTDYHNLPGYQQGRLSPDQVQLCKPVMSITRDALYSWKNSTDDENPLSRDAAERQLQTMVLIIGALVPESEQAEPGTHSYED